MARRALAVLAVLAVFVGSALAQSCDLTVGGATFNLALANNGEDTPQIDIGDGSFTAVLNACKALTAVNSPCPSGTLACQYQPVGPLFNPYRKMANYINTTYNVYDSDAGTLLVVYTGGDYCPAIPAYRTVKITYTCGGDESSLPTYVSESPGCTYNYNWDSPAGCPIGGPTPTPTSTVSPTTPAPTTVAPTTVAPTSAQPTTPVPTSDPPTTTPTADPTTVAPTTVAPTTITPTTTAPPTTTPAPTETPTTGPPTASPAPTTPAPTEAPAPLSPIAYFMIGVVTTVALFAVGIGLFALWRWSHRASSASGNDRLPLMYQSAATVKYSVTSQ